MYAAAYLLSITLAFTIRKNLRNQKTWAAPANISRFKPFLSKK